MLPSNSPMLQKKYGLNAHRSFYIGECYPRSYKTDTSVCKPVLSQGEKGVVGTKKAGIITESLFFCQISVCLHCRRFDHSSSLFHPLIACTHLPSPLSLSSSIAFFVIPEVQRKKKRTERRKGLSRALERTRELMMIRVGIRRHLRQEVKKN